MHLEHFIYQSSTLLGFGGPCIWVCLFSRVNEHLVLSAALGHACYLPAINSNVWNLKSLAMKFPFYNQDDILRI